MFKYLVLCALISHSIWAKPVHQLIVTPQAQVYLEPLAKYAGPTFIHHLSPLARIGAPQDETIVYVPASAAAPVIPIEAITAAHVGRSSGGELTLAPIAAPQLKQQEQIQQIQQAFEQAQAAASNAQAAAQEGFGQIGEQLSEAAASFSPGSFFPPPSSGSSGSSGSSAMKKDEQLKERIETPANTQPLLAAASGRQYIAIAAPAVPHIIDFVQGAPVLVSHISAIRARSLGDASQVPIAPAAPSPAADVVKADALPIKSDLPRDELLIKQDEPLQKESSLIPAEREKATDVGRFLEANALKDDAKPEKSSGLPLESPGKQQAASLNLDKIAGGQPDAKLKAVVDGGFVSAVAAPKVVDPVVEDVVAV